MSSLCSVNTICVWKDRLDFDNPFLMRTRTGIGMRTRARKMKMEMGLFSAATTAF